VIKKINLAPLSQHAFIEVQSHLNKNLEKKYEAFQVTG